MIRALLIVAPCLLAASAAGASPMCGDRQTIADYLATEHQEVPIASGTANNGGTIEVFSSDQGGSWTILITLSDGRTCMMAAGHDWQNAPLVAAASEGDPGA